ncbi:MAG: hypothetical protein J0I12_32840 [Candidatus Eremiobacteraeota bacterium]|nr:hypothetical protein [Candidatus Eremiobacteraeota bacterium]
MRRIFNLGALLLVASSLWLGGCGKPAEVSEAKTYKIYKQQVSLTPPKGWAVKEEPSPDTKDGQIAAVVFTPPTGFGHIAVTVTPEIKQTQEFMNQLGNGVRARKGKIVKEWYEHKFDDPDKQNAYFMEYDLQDAGVGHAHQKGMQVQIFTKENVLYSLVFTADPEVYDANKTTFEALVKSFEKAK